MSLKSFESDICYDFVIVLYLIKEILFIRSYQLVGPAGSSGGERNQDNNKKQGQKRINSEGAGACGRGKKRRINYIK